MARKSTESLATVFLWDQQDRSKSIGGTGERQGSVLPSSLFEGLWDPEAETQNTRFSQEFH